MGSVNNGLIKKQMFRFIGWYFLANAMLFWLAGLPYLWHIFSSESLFTNQTINLCHSRIGQCLIVVLVLMNYCSYLLLLAFIPALFVLLVTCFIPSRRFIFFLSVLVASFSFVYLLIDCRVYLMFKFHINASLLSMVVSPDWRDVLDLSFYEVLLFMLALVLVLLIECVVASLLWKKIILTSPSGARGKDIAVMAVGGVLISYFTLLLSVIQSINLLPQQLVVLPLFSQLFSYVVPLHNAEGLLRRLSEQDFSQPLFPNDTLHYPLNPLQCKAPATPYNIILIGVDSLRADSLQAMNMPKVAAFASKGWWFHHHLSGGNATQPGLFSLFYSLPSQYWTAALKQKKAPLLTELLHHYHYSTRVFTSSEMTSPPFDQTIYLKINYFQARGSRGDKGDVGSRDRYISKKAIHFLESESSKQPFFLHLFYNAPHAFCSKASYPTPYQPTSTHCSRLFVNNTTDPLPFFNRYLNAVQFIDDEVGHVLDMIEKKGFLKNTIVIFTSDHGQEFNDNHHDFWGHSSNFTDAQVHIPLVVYWPSAKPLNIDNVTTSYDVIPTLFQRLFACSNPSTDYSVGQDLLTKKGRLPFVLVGSYINMGMIEPDRITTFEVSGRVVITDKHATMLPDAKPRAKVMNGALALMRQYFK